MKLNKKYKNEFLDEINPLNLPFWKSCQPYFSKKHSFSQSKITLTEKGKTMTDSSKVAKTFERSKNKAKVSNKLKILL